jgi:hypothetical protein
MFDKDFDRLDERGRASEPLRPSARRAGNPEGRLSRWAAALDGRPPASLETGAPGLVAQKKAVDDADGSESEEAQAQPTLAPALLLDGEVEGPLATGQMRKSDFLAQRRAAVCATAEEALANTIWSADGCPWIEWWFAYYAGRDAAQVEAAAHKYVPQTRGVADASDLIPLLAERVRAGIAEWSASGEVSGVPEDLPRLPGGTHEAAAPVAQKAQGDGAGLARAHPAGLQRELGPGQPLDAGVRSQMEGALGAVASALDKVESAIFDHRVFLTWTSLNQTLSPGERAKFLAWGRESAVGLGCRSTQSKPYFATTRDATAQGP